MLAGAPVLESNVTSCPSPFCDGVMVNRMVSPAVICTKLGLNAVLRVKTSYVLFEPAGGVVGLSEPPHAAVKRRTARAMLTRIEGPTG